MGKVFLIQSTQRRNAAGEMEDKFDVHTAKRFGELETLLPGGPVVSSAAPMLATLRYKLRNYSDGDYLLALGGPAEIGAATAVAASKNGGRVNMLVWDKVARSYVAVRLDIYGTQAGSNDDAA